MINLAAAAAFLLALHTLPSTPLRPWAVDRLGSKALFGGLWAYLARGIGVAGHGL